MFGISDTFFFEQTSCREPLRRRKKLLDDVLQGFSFLNPKLVNGLSKESKPGDSEPATEDIKDGLLPDISSAFNLIKNQIVTSLAHNEDVLRYMLLEQKQSAPDVLSQLAVLLPLVQASKRKIELPRSLEYRLQCGYGDLIYDASYVKREWQLPQNQVQHEAELRAQADKDKKDVGSAFNEPDKVKPELTDSEDDSAEREARVQTHLLRKSSRKLRSQPITIREEKPSSRGSRPGTNSKSRSETSLRKPFTAPDRHLADRHLFEKQDKRHLLDAGRVNLSTEDIISEAELSNGATSYPQQYSTAILNFNLANIGSMEDRGCRLFGLEQPKEVHHPLELMVQRLNEAMRQVRSNQAEAKQKNCTNKAFICYYDDKFDEKLVERAQSERIGVYNTVMRGGRPRIPSLLLHKKKQTLCAQTTDGSRVVFYDNGQPAVVSSFSGDKGYQVVAYDKEKPDRMLAVFTPTGNGCCYHQDGSVRLLLTERGGHFIQLADSGEEWLWPSPPGKLNPSLSVQLNHHMSVKVNSQSNVTLTFVAHSHSIKFSVGKTEGATQISPDDLVLFPMKVLDSVTYTSSFATDLAQKSKQLSLDNAAAAKRPVNRGSKTTKKDRLRGSVDFSEELSTPAYDGRMERELSRLKTKARTLVDDWMDMYRLYLGIAVPQMRRLQDSRDLRSRHAVSAKSTPGDFQNYNADDLATTPIPDVGDANGRRRAPSAPTGRLTDGYISAHQLSELFPNRDKISTRAVSSAGRNREPEPAELRAVKPLTQARATSDTAMSSADWTYASHLQCPIVLRHQMLSRQRELINPVQTCRCSHRCVPYMTDVELDQFVSRIVPRSQQIVLSVISSLYPDEGPGPDTLNWLHKSKNASRTHTCAQSGSDSFRLFRYDIATAFFDTNCNQALLLTRHNAVPGMFLIYQNGKLIFCDHIFNGYGFSKKDFQKQLVECRQRAQRGFSLPVDFKFSAHRLRQGLALRCNDPSDRSYTNQRDSKERIPLLDKKGTETSWKGQGQTHAPSLCRQPEYSQESLAWDGFSQSKPIALTYERTTTFLNKMAQSAPRHLRMDHHLATPAARSALA